jgi:hypothetical protein
VWLDLAGARCRGGGGGCGAGVEDVAAGCLAWWGRGRGRKRSGRRGIEGDRGAEENGRCVIRGRVTHTERVAAEVDSRVGRQTHSEIHISLCLNFLLFRCRGIL